jgi:hypothetical protein
MCNKYPCVSICGPCKLSAQTIFGRINEIKKVEVNPSPSGMISFEGSERGPDQHQSPGRLLRTGPPQKRALRHDHKSNQKAPGIASSRGRHPRGPPISGRWVDFARQFCCTNSRHCSLFSRALITKRLPAGRRRKRPTAHPRSSSNFHLDIPLMRSHCVRFTLTPGLSAGLR